jgi:hypothetical protein
VEENSSLVKPAATSGYLKSVNVECQDIDGRVCKVLKFLSILDVEIIIKRTKFLLYMCKSIIMLLIQFSCLESLHITAVKMCSNLFHLSTIHCGLLTN